jgi:hypothetical protein
MLFEQLPAEIKSFYDGKGVRIRNVRFDVNHISGDESYVIESHNSDGWIWKFSSGVWKNTVIPRKTAQTFRR